MATMNERRLFPWQRYINGILEDPGPTIIGIRSFIESSPDRPKAIAEVELYLGKPLYYRPGLWLDEAGSPLSSAGRRRLKN
jgi:hypothetical protein